MPFPWTDLLVIAGLILLNGLFAMSELAIVSARSSRLRMAAERGSAAAKTVLELSAEPGKFLSTVQIGITLVGIVAGAYSGARLGGPVGDRLAAIGVPGHLAYETGFALVIIVTTYFSLVIGELVPKQLADFENSVVLKESVLETSAVLEKSEALNDVALNLCVVQGQ